MSRQPTREGVLENSGKSLVKTVEVFDGNLVDVTCRNGFVLWETSSDVGVYFMDLGKYYTLYFL